MLKGGRLSAGEIGRHFDMTGATISYHLSRLKEAGLVFEAKQKNFVYYELNLTVFEELMLWLSQFQEDQASASERSMKDGGAESDDMV